MASGCPKPKGFEATLKCYKSEQYGGCGRKQEPTVLSQSHPTLLACLEELRNRIEQKYSASCMKAAGALECADKTVSQSRAAKGLLACAPSATDAMMRLRDAKIRAAAANKVALESKQEKDAREDKVENLQHVLGVKRGRAKASKIENDEGAAAYSKTGSSVFSI